MEEARHHEAPTLRARFDGCLIGFLEAQDGASDGPVGTLAGELVALVRAGGKRLRPTFCYWGHLASGGTDSERVIRAASALELVHTFALIHDDVMDRSAMRRGRPSSFRVLADAARQRPHQGDPERLGEVSAVLAGDLALVWADRLLAGSGFGLEELARARERFDAMRARAIGGQLADLEAAFAGRTSEAQARRIGALKSGGYTVADPLAIGAALGSDDARVQRVLAAYGRPLGEAFQLTDDVLGLFGDPSVTGKDRDGDLREGKQTVLVAKARAAASSTQRELIDEALGRPDLEPDHADVIREIVRRTGALDDTLALIASLAQQARSALDPHVLPSRVVDALAELADEVTQRDR